MSAPLAVAAAFRYQACDDRSCLPPVTTEDAVDLVADLEQALARLDR